MLNSRFQPEDKVKIGSCLCTKCHIIRGLYDDAKISDVVHEI